MKRNDKSLKKLDEAELIKMRKYADVYRDVLAKECGLIVADGSPYGFVISGEEYDNYFMSAKEFLDNLDFEYVNQMLCSLVEEDPDMSPIDEAMSNKIAKHERTVEYDYCLDMLPVKYYSDVKAKREALLEACRE